jgi:hypothetical protein
VLEIASINAGRKGRVSLWLAGVGIVMSLCVAQDSGLFGYNSISQPFSGYFVFGFIGLVCDFWGLLLGALSRKTGPGKVGLVLSFLALASLPALIFAYHAHNGNWPWLTDDDCSCM